ncbi:MAG: hypothetical protein HUU60_10755 [Armatimonadetes bacterium]|nr:hypothetical protein [Armatimonadota bacterium]
MKARFSLMVSAALVGLVGTAFSQIQEIAPEVVTLNKDQINIRRINLSPNAGIQGDLRPPVLFSNSTIWKQADDGTYSFTYFADTNWATTAWGDHGQLAGGLNAAGTGRAYFGPWSVTSPVACVYEVDVLLFAPVAVGNVAINLRLRNWNGTSADDPFVSSVVLWESGVLNLGPAAAGDILYVTVPVPPTNGDVPLPLTKGFLMELNSIVGAGWIISNGTPGNVHLEPGRCTFRRQTPAGAFTFTTSMVGSFAYALRGTHNVVLQLDHSALAERAQPIDPFIAGFDQDNDGVEEGMRKNMVQAEYVTAGFTTRYDSYVDEQGLMTLPVDLATVTGLNIRRMDNGLGVSFAVSGSVTLCDFLFGSAEIIWGDVNGDGVIDDIDLAVVLTNFGASE